MIKFYLIPLYISLCLTSASAVTSVNTGLFDLNKIPQEFDESFSTEELSHECFSGPVLHPSLDLTLSASPSNEGDSVNHELKININPHYNGATKINDLRIDDVTSSSDRKRRKVLANQIIPFTKTRGKQNDPVVFSDSAIIRTHALQQDKGKQPTGYLTYESLKIHLPELQEIQKTLHTRQNRMSINGKEEEHSRKLEHFQMDNWNFLCLNSEIQRGKQQNHYILKNSFHDLKLSRRDRIFRSDSEPFCLN